MSPEFSAKCPQGIRWFLILSISNSMNKAATERLRNEIQGLPGKNWASALHFQLGILKDPPFKSKGKPQMGQSLKTLPQLSSIPNGSGDLLSHCFLQEKLIPPRGSKSFPTEYHYLVDFKFKLLLVLCSLLHHRYSNTYAFYRENSVCLDCFLMVIIVATHDWSGINKSFFFCI